MKKRYIFGTIVLLIVVFFFVSILCGLDKKDEEAANSALPRIGQRVWTYNMNKHEWRAYNKSMDEDDSKDEIILQVQAPEGNGGYSVYNLITGNAQVPKEPVWIGEASEEFLIGKNLYSYFPKEFEFYEVIFNGVMFVPRKLSEKEVGDILKDYRIIKVSDLKKGNYSINFSKNNSHFVVLNDMGENFYKYYIVPNDSKKLEIQKFSNQFILKDKVDIMLQRLEGCSKAYPCYDIKVK